MEKTLTIINGCRQRTHKYQKILYERYRAFALKTVFRYIYNYEEALEVSNDGFVKFFLGIEKFRCENEADIEKLLGGWIKRIMINTSIDLLRKKMLLPEIGGIPDYVWDIKDKSASADQMAIYKDLIQLVKKLPPAYRIVFNMHVIDGYTHIEIAETLGIPVGTSKSNLLRAKALMKKYLNQKEELSECSI
ncbi:MAG TPA: sigma-70 family RNA polymerase sigma factor [Chitinophagaceae bacterium]|nr:sigma-70 family RNA polymerase sigma factor [Chitinophagaceae bacterium]